MKSNGTKHSASAVTFLRALASHSPDTHLFHDPYAEQFLTPRLVRLAKSPRTHRLMKTAYRGISSIPLLNKAMRYWRVMGEQAEIVFDYADGRFFKEKPKTLSQKVFEGFFRSGKEPLKTGFYIDELGGMLKNNGFSLLDNKPGWEQEKLYPADMIGIFPPSRLTHLAYAKGLNKALANQQQA